MREKENKRHLTVTLCNYLSNCIQSLFCTTDYKFDFDEKNRNRAKRLKIVYHSSFGGDTTFENGFGMIRKSKVEYSNKTIKDLKANFDLDCYVKSSLALTGDRNRDVASAVSCQSGGPYCTSIISMSSTIDLKRAVGIRERCTSKVTISFIPQLGLSPTIGAAYSYLILEKLT